MNSPADLHNILNMILEVIYITIPFVIAYFFLRKKNIKSNKSLRESNEELEEFAYVASHDIQEPVRMINQNIKRLEEHLSQREILDEKAKKYIQFIDNGSNLIQVLITDLLEYSRLESELIEFEQVNLNEVLELAKINLDLKIKESEAQIISEKLPTVYGVKSLLLRLFINLISNSIKYRNLVTAPKINVECYKKHNHYFISFEDNGIGFDPKYAKAIFKIFYRLHSPHTYSGTGIGLAACEKIVRYHHGKIFAVSELGRGSKFTVQLPVKFGLI